MSIPEGSTVVLFFGRVRKYKGVPEFVAAFRKARRDEVYLVIAGSCSDADLKAEIRSSAGDDHRIRLYLKSIEDADVAPLFRVADIAVVPFERTLTSGSVVLAMTMGKPLLLPEAARIFDLVDEGGIFYRSLEEIPTILDKLRDDTILEMGKRNRERSLELDWNRIGELTTNAYEGRYQR
jgi:glycosyltransferase involved in cell wall biosynthesis